MRTIIIRSIPHHQQRYDTVGDWFDDGKITFINVSELSSIAREHLIAVHELVEYLLCSNAGISQAEVDRFDKKNQAKQPEVELGDLSDAPYRKQHCIATGVERIIAAELGVSWSEYEEELTGLS